MEEPRTGRKAKPLPEIIQLWERQLLRTEGGALKRELANTIMLLTSDQDWRGVLGWDSFAGRTMIRRKCPVGDPGPWGDIHEINTVAWLQQSRWKHNATREMVSCAAASVARSASFHPLRDKLNSLKWDGQPRVDTWLTNYLGAEDTPVHRAIASTWLLGAVSRAFSPGCQVDAALVLEGLQGAGKSTALRTLAMGFFTDELADVGSKDAAMQLHGKWIVELSELDALSRAEVTRVKSFITRRVDIFRAPYGRHIEDHPRSNVFAGTTNQSDYLRDDSGNRRWLPTLCGEVRAEELTRDVEQLWSEAVIRYRAGEPTYIKDRDVVEALRHHTATRYQGDVWTEAVMAYAERPQNNQNVSIPEVLEHVGIERGRWSRSDELRVAKILKSEGWERRQVYAGGRRSWRYFLPKLVTVGGSVGDGNEP